MVLLSTNLFTNSIKKPTHQKLWMPQIWGPQLLPHPFLMFPMHNPTLLSLLTHKHFRALPQEKTGDPQHLAWFCRIERRYTILVISPKKSRKCGVGIPTEDVWNHFRILAGLTCEGISVQKPVSEVWRGTGSFKSEKSNVRLQGNWKIKEIQHHQRNTIIF